MIIGEVIRGDGVGKKLGYPTANLDVTLESAGLEEGVYAAYAFLNKKKYKAALAIQQTTRKVEVHLLGYKGPDFYGRKLEVEAMEQVSGMEKCKTREDLIKKIERDIKKIINKF